MKFERKIYLGFIFTALAFFPAVIGAFFAIQKVVSEQNSLVATNAQIVLLAEKLRSVFSAQSSLIPVYLLSGKTDLIEQFHHEYQNFEKIALAIADIDPHPEDLKEIANIRGLARVMRESTLSVIQMKQQGQNHKVVNDQFRKVTLPNEQALTKHLNNLVFKESADFEDAKVHVAKVVDQVVAALLILAVLALGLVFLIGRLTFKVMRQQRAYEETQKELLKKEQMLSQARKETVEVVAHDLKNPLGSIKMSLDLVLSQIDGGLTSKELQDYLQIAYRSTESMEKLIRDLLDHAKIEAGHLILETENCDLAKLAAELILRFHPLVENKKLTLIDNITGPAFVECDSGRIEQVIANLLGNALKFTPTKGTISLSLKVQGGQVHISIEDSGPGVPTDQLPHIFDRFWQVRETASQGTGLGLAIAKAIVEEHKGKIWVESTLGVGSQFHITLPVSS